MLVVMKNDATEEQVSAVIEEIEKMGYRGMRWSPKFGQVAKVGFCS